MFRALSFYIFYFFVWLFSLVPLPVLFIISDILFVIIYFIVGYRKKVVRENLMNSFPEKNINEIKKIERAYYRHFCDLVFENVRLLTMGKAEIQKRCLIKNPEVLNNYYSLNRSVIGYVGHYGNWELGIMLPLVCQYKVLAIYKPISNPYFNRFYFNLRSRFGIEPVSMKESYRKMQAYDKSHTPILTVFIGDQTPHLGDIQYETMFLNQKTPVFLGTEKVARKLNHVVVYLKMQKVKRGKYEVTVVPLYENPADTADYEITHGHLLELENSIKDKPEHWLWSHRRWKYSSVNWKGSL